MSDTDVDLESRAVCSTCIGETFLKSIVEKNGSDEECFYCGDSGKALLTEQLAEYFETALSQHFTCTSPEPDSIQRAMLSDKESDYEWERDGDPILEVISTMADIDEELASDIREILENKHWSKDLYEMDEENQFSEEAHYSEKDIDDSSFNGEWEHFENSLKTRNRYFSQGATLKKIFSEINSLKGRNENPIVVEAGPGKALSFLFRARVMQSNDVLDIALKSPEQEIGPPPPAKALNGRMNAKGIAVFYGAMEPEIAIAEVRPPVGSRVVVGKFNIVRPIRLLDVEAFSTIIPTGSVFDPEFLGQLEHAKFLGRLSFRISRPVMPDDESTDYLATQAVADYLSGSPKLNLDGIIYPSVWGGSGKRNVVLFQKSCKVWIENLKSEIDVSQGWFNEDGYESDYWVWETKPKEPSDSKINSNILRPYNDRADNREISLKLDRKKIEVHHIEKIEVITNSFKVKWHERNQNAKAEF